jgi:chromosome segregation protein
MRFDRLDILRYGALTERSLSFRPDARLHIVYGPNEAGKSSALSAISDLLFGFPERSDYGFLHDPASLRIGAAISAAGGEALAFRRRKGRKNTLLAHADAEQALPDDALSPFLGTLSREVFKRAFGLDSASLRAGGETMLKSSGEIGSLLFSAASGLTGLSSLRKSLDGEADAIYSQRRSKDRRFYQVLDAHEAARKAERESELRSADWKKLLGEEAQIASDLQTVQGERERTKRALDRLNRLMRLDPIIREIDRESERLAHFDRIGELPAGAAADLAVDLEDSRLNGEAGRAAQAEVERLQAEMEAVHVDQALLSASSTILSLHARSGAYSDARQDVVRVRSEVDDFDQRLTAAARRLGLIGSAELQRLQPADADLVRLRGLVEEGQELDRSLSQSARQIEEERKILRDLEADMGPARIVDPRPGADQLVALRPYLSDLSAMEALRIRVQRAESDLAGAAARLDPPVRDVAQLLSSSLPGIEALSDQRRVIENARLDSARSQQSLEALKQEIASVEGELAALEGTGEIVSRETIGAARAVRDDLLAELESGQPAVMVVGKLREATGEADRLADAALSDAERVSRHARLRLSRRELEQRLAAAQAKLREADIAVADAVTEFEDLFRQVPIVPSTPDRMIEWRRAVDQLTRLSAVLEEARDELDVLRLKEEQVRPTLIALADTTGIVAGSMPLAGLARALERKVEELTSTWNDRRSMERSKSDAEKKIANLETAAAEVEGRVRDWRQAFSHASAAAGLPEDATVEMALAALDVWRTVPALVDERENRDRRVRGMARDMQDFEDAVKAVCAEAAPDISAVPADGAADALSRRLTAANALQNRKAALSETLERATQVRDRATAESDAIRQRLAEFASTASVDVSDLSALLENLHARERASNALDQCRARFAEQADGMSEADIRDELQGFDRITAAVEAETLEAADNRQIEALKSLGIAQADSDRRRRELETGIGAERAAFEKLAAEEEARDLARRWVVLKLAATLLSQSMENYRERQADPVMKRAGQLFSDLTGSRFARIVQLYDDQDELQLAVERRTGEQVPLTGLSEGTGDQLYLALRLAFLEDYCRRNEPAPFVLDDIFQTFDDERTAAGLRTLAEAGGSFQTILFTHQMSLVETARRELGDRMDLVRLDRPEHG